MQVGNIRPSEICEYPKKVGFLVHQHEIGGLFYSEIREKGVFVVFRNASGANFWAQLGGLETVKCSELNLKAILKTCSLKPRYNHL